MELTEIFQNSGFCFVTKEIVSYLDVKSAMNCRLLNKTWKEVIDLHWWNSQLKAFQSRQIPFMHWFKVKTTDHDYYGKTIYTTKSRRLMDQYPAWKDVFEYFTNEATDQQVIEFVKYLGPYFYKIHSYSEVSKSPVEDEQRCQTRKLKSFLRSLPITDYVLGTLSCRFTIKIVAAK